MLFPRQFFAQDVVRLAGSAIRTPSVTTFAANLRKSLLSSSWGSFNYIPGKSALPGLLAGHVSLEEAVRMSRSRGNPIGYDANEQIVRGAHDLFKTREIRFRPLASKMVEVRPGLAIKLDPLGYFIEGGRAKVLMIQPRRGLRPTTEGYGMWLSMAREKICVDDLYGASVEIASFDEPKGRSRIVHTFDFENAPSFTKSEIDQFLAEYGLAYELIVTEGLPPHVWRKRSGPGPSGGDLF